MVFACMVLALLSWGEEYENAINTYSHLLGQMFSEGWLSYSETGGLVVHEDFMNWTHHSDYALYVERVGELGMEFARYDDTRDIPEPLVEEYIQLLHDLNAYLADFLGTSTEQLALDAPDVSAVEPPEQASFATANVRAEGDALAVDRVRFRLQNIQGYYDTISGQLESGQYDLASRNIENMRGTLSTLSEEVIELRGSHRLSITFLGLPGDEAMRAYRELEEQRERNYRLWEYAQKTVQDLDAASAAQDLAFITSVWRTAYQSMLDWHSPPAWYEVPQTFYGWYRDSEERAGLLLRARIAMERLREARNEMDILRSTSLETHQEIVDSLSEMEPLVDIHSSLLSLFSELGWAGFTGAG